MNKYCYLDGEIIKIAQAKISVNDLGILRGWGVFDLIRTYGGKPFLLKEHLERLKNSAKIAGIEIPFSQKQLASIIKQLLLKNHLTKKESIIRIILTGGVKRDERKIRGAYPTFFILIEDLKPLPEKLKKEGIKIRTYQYQRELPQVKTINYFNAWRLKKWAEKKGAREILYVWQGKVLEATTSNFFIFKNNVLITAKNNILLGATRNLAINLAKAQFKIEQRDLNFKELSGATEAFITATTKEILPAVKIDAQKIGNGRVGKNTKFLMDLFQQYIKKFK